MKKGFVFSFPDWFNINEMWNHTNDISNYKVAYDNAVLNGSFSEQLFVKFMRNSRNNSFEILELILSSKEDICSIIFALMERFPKSVYICTDNNLSLNKWNICLSHKDLQNASHVKFIIIKPEYINKPEGSF